MSDQELYLPVEIVERVFYFLDGLSVTKLSRVNSIWRASYNNILNRKDAFELYCRREIAPEDLLSIVERLYPTYVTRQIDWLRVYKCWSFWKGVEKWAPNKETLVEEHCCCIICIKILGDWLFYGTHSEGKVEAYHLKTKTKTPKLYNGFGVRDIAFCLSDRLKDPFGDSQRTMSLFLQCNRTVSLVVRCSDTNQVKVENASYNNYVDCTFEQWPSVVQSSLCAKLKSLGYGHDNHLVKPIIRSNYLVSAKRNKEVEVVDNSSQVLSNNCNVIFRGYQVVKNWHQLSANVSFGTAMTPFHAVYFAVGNQLRVYVPSSFMFTVRAALLHCNMLFLGNSKGVVYMFKLKSDQDLLSFDYSSYYVSQFKVDNKCVVAIDIQYTDDSVPFLLVASESSIHKIF